MAGDKPIIEVSLCRKQKGRNNEPDTFCWIRVTIWQPPEFMSRLVKGSWVAGSGEMTTRSYEKDGEKRTSIEIRCGSYDVEIGDSAPGDAVVQQAQALVTRPTATGGGKGSAGGSSFDEPPFHPLSFWG